MKKILIIIGFVLTYAFCIAQTSNSERLSQIDSEIENAVSSGDYGRAAELKKEREIREEIDKAIASGDFDRAAQLKRQLNGGNQSQTTPTKQNYPAQNNNSSQSTGTKNNLSQKQDLPNKITKSGFYIELLLGRGNTNSISGALIGFNFGNKFFFGDKSRMVRVGLDINWSSLSGVIDRSYGGGGFNNVGGAILYMPINPGITTGTSFTDDIGLEANFYMGQALIFSNLSSVPDVAVGLRFSPQFKFRYKALAVGFEFRYIRTFNIPIGFRGLGLIVGAKF